MCVVHLGHQKVVILTKADSALTSLLWARMRHLSWVWAERTEKYSYRTLINFVYLLFTYGNARPRKLESTTMKHMSAGFTAIPLGFEETAITTRHLLIFFTPPPDMRKRRSILNTLQLIIGQLTEPSELQRLFHLMLGYLILTFPQNSSNSLKRRHGLKTEPTLWRSDKPS